MKLNRKKLNQSGFDHIMLVVAVVVVFALVGSFLLFMSRAASPTVELQSEVGSNVCVAGGQSAGGRVYLATCNGSVGEQWQAAGGVIKNSAAPGGPYCLQPPPSTKLPLTGNTLTGVVAEKCSGVTAQQWNGSGNPTFLKNKGASSTTGSGKCLVDPNNSVSPSTYLGIIGCSSYADQTWNTHATYTATAPAPPKKPAPPTKPAPPKPPVQATTCVGNQYSSGEKDTGKSVCIHAIQNILNSAYIAFGLNHDASPLLYKGATNIQITGVFDTATVGQVKAFQTFIHTELAPTAVTSVDGIVGPQTWKALCYTAHRFDAPYYNVAGCTSSSI